MDRFWLLTNTCYGNWLPGDERGFVGRVVEHRSTDPEWQRRIVHNSPGTQYDVDMPGLVISTSAAMKGPPIHLRPPQAETLLSQFRQTANYRGWELLAVAVMFNHFHIVVGVNGDPKPSKVLGDFKSWGTRRLTEAFGQPASKTWWTERGSTRKLTDEATIAAAINYVLHEQPNPLAIWAKAPKSQISALSVEPSKANTNREV